MAASEQKENYLKLFDLTFVYTINTIFICEEEETSGILVINSQYIIFENAVSEAFSLFFSL